VTLTDLDQRLARIEELLTTATLSPQRTAKAPGAREESRTQPSNPRKGG
jgi:hypothetical protein